MNDFAQLLQHVGALLGVTDNGDGGGSSAPAPDPNAPSAGPAPDPSTILPPVGAGAAAPADLTMPPLPPIPMPGGPPSSMLPAVPDSLAPPIMPAQNLIQKPMNDHSTSDRLMALLAGGPAGFARQVMAQHQQQRVAGVIKASMTNGQFDPDLYIQNAANAGLPVTPGDIQTLQNASAIAAQRRARAITTLSPGQLSFDNTSGKPVAYNPADYTLSPGQHEFRDGQELSSVAPNPVTLSQGQSAIDPETGKTIASVAPAPVALAKDTQLYGVTPPSTGGGSGGIPRSVRNNNPGNVTLLPHGQWDGQIDHDGKFAVFATPQAGMAAADKNLLAKQTIHGLSTLNDIIGDPRYGWAPASDHNDPTAYAATVAKAVGIAPDQQINLQDPGLRSRILQAMFKVEAGGSGAAPTPAKATLLATGIQTPDTRPLSADEITAHGLDPANSYQVDGTGKITLIGPARKPSGADGQTLKALRDRVTKVSQLADLGDQYVALNQTQQTGGIHGFIAPMEGAFSPGSKMAHMQAIYNQMIPLQREIGSGPIRMGEISGPGGGIWGGAVPRAANPLEQNAAIAKGWRQGANEATDHLSFLESWAQRKGTLLGGEQAYRQWRASVTRGHGGQGAPAAPTHGGDVTKMSNDELMAAAGLH